jgi:hypothetical protein
MTPISKVGLNNFNEKINVLANFNDGVFGDILTPELTTVSKVRLFFQRFFSCLFSCFQGEGKKHEDLYDKETTIIKLNDFFSENNGLLESVDIQELNKILALVQKLNKNTNEAAYNLNNTLIRINMAIQRKNLNNAVNPDTYLSGSEDVYIKMQ